MASIELSNGRRIVGATGGTELTPGAPLALMIHGAAMNRTVWSLQTRWLAHHGCQALAIDLPGHGASTEAEQADIVGYGEWVAELVVALERPVHLVGHSMGSFIALEAAIRAPAASLTMVGTAASMPVHPALLEAAERNDPLAARLMSGWAFAHITRAAPHPAPGSSMVGSTQAMIGQAAPGVLFHDLTMCAAYEQAVDSAGKVDAPTTLLLGELDRMTPVGAAKPLIEAFAEPTVEIVPGSGHMVQIESPARTRELLAAAMRRAAGGV